uniref:Uncharacterized protein n=1 Tax=uncultured Nitrospirota bacterium TaxID=170969 RepID=A0A142BU38_9BACT|nr:hypothetical protein [uncultured Nitrospirota bacterium]
MVIHHPCLVQNELKPVDGKDRNDGKQQKQQQKRHRKP